MGRIDPGKPQPEAVVLKKGMTHYLRPGREGVISVKDGVRDRVVLVLKVVDHSLDDSQEKYRLVVARDFSVDDPKQDRSLVLAAARQGHHAEPSRLVIAHHLAYTDQGQTREADLAVAMRGVRDPQLVLTTDRLWGKGLGLTNLTSNGVHYQEVVPPWATTRHLAARIPPADFKVAPHIRTYKGWGEETLANPPEGIPLSFTEKFRDWIDRFGQRG